MAVASPVKNPIVDFALSSVSSSDKGEEVLLEARQLDASSPSFQIPGEPISLGDLLISQEQVNHDQDLLSHRLSDYVSS